MLFIFYKTAIGDANAYQKMICLMIFSQKLVVEKVYISKQNKKYNYIYVTRKKNDANYPFHLSFQEAPREISVLTCCI